MDRDRFRVIVGLAALAAAALLVLRGAFSVGGRVLGAFLPSPATEAAGPPGPRVPVVKPGSDSVVPGKAVPAGQHRPDPFAPLPGEQGSRAAPAQGLRPRARGPEMPPPPPLLPPPQGVAPVSPGDTPSGRVTASPSPPPVDGARSPGNVEVRGTGGSGGTRQAGSDGGKGVAPPQVVSGDRVLASVSGPMGCVVLASRGGKIVVEEVQSGCPEPARD